jgi:hypothetical protein
MVATQVEQDTIQIESIMCSYWNILKVAKIIKFNHLIPLKLIHNS